MNANKSTILIFDYMRTLYNPDQMELFDGVCELLRLLKEHGYRLMLVSRKEGQRREDIKKFCIEESFERIELTDDKRWTIREIKEDNPHAKIWVIGDRALEEIKHGKDIGASTIWLKKGKFEDEFDEKHIQPDFIINDITQVFEIIQN